MQKLKVFLEDWLEWAERPRGLRELSKAGIMYSTCSGLCNNARFYMLETDIDVCSALEEEFLRDGLDPDYPFGAADYDGRNEEFTMHKCPIRLQWVRATIQRLETTPDV
jgi:hypothetical protein